MQGLLSDEANCKQPTYVKAWGISTFQSSFFASGSSVNTKSEPLCSETIFRTICVCSRAYASEKYTYQIISKLGITITKQNVAHSLKGHCHNYY